MHTRPIVKQKKSILMIAWLAPIIAIIISYSMLDKYLEQKGNEITIYTTDIKDLEVGKSHIEFKGLKIGKLTSIIIDKHNLKRFKISAQVYKEFNYFIKEGSIFWIVSPKISMDKISNLGTILTGNYIEILPQTLDINKLNNLKKQDTFIAYENEPHKKGKTINLTAKDSTISQDTKIKYKGIEVGKILTKELSTNNKLIYKILIYENYTKLINNNTLFYQIEPLDLKISATELSLKIKSIDNLISTSISFINDSNLQNKDNKQLYKNKDEIYSNSNGIRIKLSSGLISKNEQILYKNIKIGFIENTILVGNKLESTGFIYNKYKNLINNSTQFYKLQDLNMDISLDGIDLNIGSFKQMAQGGISFITKTKKDKLTTKIFHISKSLKELNITNNKHKYFTITLNLKDAYNLKTTSKLYYKNIDIGEVISIEMNGIIKVQIKINKKYRKLFNQNAKIYLEGTKISLNGIKNISSTVLGDKLYLVPGFIDRSFQNEFTLDSVNPIDTKYEDGLRVIVTHNDGKDISINAPVYYNHFKIGNIEDIKLNLKTNKINIIVFIYQDYKKYIQKHSIFKKTDIIDISLGLLNSEIKIGNFEALFKGGLDVISPKELNNQASNGDKYILSIENN